MQRPARSLALLLPLALLVAACGRGQEPGGGTPAPTPTETPAASESVAPRFDATRIAATDPLGSGMVQAVLPASDGSSTVLVTGTLPGNATGCEGMPLEGLMSLAGGGDPTPVLAADGSEITDGVRIALPPVAAVDHPVALASTCESFTSRVLLGIVGHGGVPTDLVAIAGVGAPAGAPAFETLFDLSFSPDATTLYAVIGPYSAEPLGGTPDTTLWSYDVAGGTWSQVTSAQPGLIAAVAFGDGGIAQIVGGTVLHGGHEFPANGATRLVVGPDGETIGLAGGSGLQVISPDGTLRTLDTASIGFVGFTADGSGIVYARVNGNDVTLVQVDLLTEVASDLGTSAWGWFAVYPDGSGLAVTVDGPNAERWSFPAL